MELAAVPAGVKNAARRYKGNGAKRSDFSSLLYGMFVHGVQD